MTVPPCCATLAARRRLEDVRRRRGRVYAWTREVCHSSLVFILTIGILHREQEWGRENDGKPSSKLARLPEPARRGGDLPERVQRAGAGQRPADLPGPETAVFSC